MNIRQVVADSIQSIQNAHDRRLCAVIQEINGSGSPTNSRVVETLLMQLRRDMAEDTQVFLDAVLQTKVPTR